MDAMKVYKLPNGRCYQYRAGEQPEGAVEVKMATEPETPEKRATTRKRAPRKKAE